MKVEDALEALQSEEVARAIQHCELKMAIPVFRPGSIGPTPRVEVTGLSVGFDWDRGVLFAHPEQTLTTLTPEEVADIRASVARGQSWHAYQAYKRQHEQLLDAQSEAARYRQALEEIAICLQNADAECFAQTLAAIKAVLSPAPT